MKKYYLDYVITYKIDILSFNLLDKLVIIEYGTLNI